jgi:uncharacterized membrane protein YkoI
MLPSSLDDLKLQTTKGRNKYDFKWETSNKEKEYNGALLIGKRHFNW